MPSDTPTALRSLGERTDEGWILLRDVGSSYRDGAEEALYDLLLAAEESELGSTDDTLLSRTEGWAQQYHVHPARANVVRPLTIPDGARVLEIGAGCGAVSRYLGETGAQLDALEPVPSRARVARARTRDLPNVEVFVGELSDVPEIPTYDVVIVVGVLEYVGGGSRSDDPYREFLAGIAARLVPGGTLVLAIENKLGAKYLAGAPEDHTDRVFDSVESYPHGGPARTFDRHALEALMRSAGLDPTTRVAFPDYKMTRAVLDVGALEAGHRSLLHRVPAFPSPDWASPRARGADEGLLWRSFVEAGLATETGNSFVVLARTAGGDPSGLWPEGTAGTFFSTGRRSRYAARTRLLLDGDGLRFDRQRLAPATDGPIQVVGSVVPFQQGVDLLEAVATEEPLTALQPLLDRWVALLDERVREDRPTPVDLLPHNLLVGPDGDLVVVDEEWTSTEATREDVLTRGVIWLALALTQRVVPERLPGYDTVGDVARAIGRMVGLDDEGHWLSPAIEREAAFQASVQQAPEGEAPDAGTARHRANFLVALGTPLIRTALGEREHELRRRAEMTLVHVTTLLDAARGNAAQHLADAQQAIAHAQQLEQRLTELDAELRSIRQHPVVRVARLATRAARKVAPEGSPQREAYRTAKQKAKGLRGDGHADRR
jgi:SAM-dependent methyltransferase